MQAFCVADDILRQGVVGISDIIVKPGLINVDFADVQAVMGLSVRTPHCSASLRDEALPSLCANDDESNKR